MDRNWDSGLQKGLILVDVKEVLVFIWANNAKFVSKGFSNNNIKNNKAEI